MKLLFVNIAYPKDIYKQLWEDSHGTLQVPSDVFQWAVIEGLERSGEEYTLVSVPALPAWPRYRSVRTPKGEICINGKIRGHYLSYCNIAAIKQISQRCVLRSYIKQWCARNKKENQLTVLVYTPSVELMGAAIDLKAEYPNLVVVPIVTDLIENAFDFSSNRSLLKRLQVKIEARGEHRLFAKVDRFVLLTRQMTECIPEAEGRFVVVEGIAPQKDAETNNCEKQESPRILLYTGVLEEYAGIRLLVDAFMKVKNDDFRLIVCGNGSGSDYVRKAMAEDKRIDFRGKVEREEAVRLQRQATLLINPRQPNGGITKYSFPSKTMEYLSSGTPMIGYRLEGIPEEYYSHIYTPVDLSTQALSECIETKLILPLEELKKKAEVAVRFIEEEKNSKAQVKKILDFILQ